MNIIIGSDHAGFDLKEQIRKYLSEKGYNIKDVGTFSHESVDYPLIAKELAQNIAEKKFSRGILLCGSGLGMSITANRFRNVRAALCHNISGSEMSGLPFVTIFIQSSLAGNTMMLIYLSLEAESSALAWL